MSGHVVFDVFLPFPTRFRPRPYIRRLSGRRRSHRPGSMLLLLARRVDLELSFGSSSNQPSPYCSEKRSLHLQLVKRTLLLSLDRSASCERWRLQGSTAHCAQPQRPMRGRRWRFLSNRKYRYHPRTQADVADFWPWYSSIFLTDLRGYSGFFFIFNGEVRNYFFFTFSFSAFHGDQMIPWWRTCMWRSTSVQQVQI